MVEVSSVGKVRRAGVGAVVALWTFFDALVLGLPILLVSAVTGRPVLVFLVGASLYALFNIGSCHWIERQWDDVVVGSSFGRRLEQLRAASARSGASRGSRRDRPPGSASLPSCSVRRRSSR